MSSPIWKPNKSQISNANITKFLSYVSQNTNIELNNYWELQQRLYNTSSWSSQASGTVQQQQTGMSSINDRITLFNFSHSFSSSHWYGGKIAEVLFWEGRTISTTELNYWGDYLAEKFSWT